MVGDQSKNKNSKIKIYDDDTLENMKKYYGIEDHTDLLKFIKLNGINHPDYYDRYEDELT
ncbi:MAG TPA: hypothetical protein VFR65_03165 [Nitrososphaeraceae archaeon]|nr:hypothetical protein [Nitrososphaeraceae archaeon]